MPKRLAVGNYLRFFKNRDDRSLASRKERASDSILRAACESLENRTLLSTTYYVSPSGNNSGPGTLAQPFKTIQEAANVANWGDTVDIEGGTYRETVTPAHSGVTFTNYDGQGVTVSGANVVSGFTNIGGSIYKATMPSNLGEGNNQVFVNGQMVTEARWPNSGPNISNPTEATVGSYSNGMLYDQAITQGNGYWDGATISITPGQAWVSYTGTVNNSGPGWLQVSLPSLGQYEQPEAGNNFYLSGTYNALSAAGQWYVDNSGHLYLWDPNSDNPNWDTVEVKQRQFAFNLDNVNNTTIEGINIFAATIQTNANSSNTTINGISAKYLTQFNNIWGSGWSPPGPYGIELNGNNSILENSTIAYSAGDGVYVDGANVRVTNNLIHDVDYSGTDAAGIMVYGSNAELDHNTIYNTGRDGINFQASPIKILNNVIYNFLLQTYDGAGIYTVGNNGHGSQIAYNTVYNAHKNLNQGYGAVGIMLDNDSSNFVVDNNVTANVDDGFKANNTSYNEQIYDNQFGASQDAMQTDGWTGYSFNWAGSQVYDNVFYNSTVMTGYNVSMWGNSYSSGSPSTNVTVTYPSAVPSVSATPSGNGGSSGGSSSSSASSSSSSSSSSSPSFSTSTPSSTSSSSSTASSSSTSSSSKTSSGSSATASAVSSAASTSASVKTMVPLNVGPAVPQKKTKAATAKVSADATKTTTVNASSSTTLAGNSIEGTFRKLAGGKKTAAIYSLAATSAALTGLGDFRLTGSGIGAVRLDAATGTIRLANAKGVITLSLSAPNTTNADPTPTSFSYLVSRATGAYKDLSAVTGTLGLTLTAGKKPTSGDFSLVLNS